MKTKLFFLCFLSGISIAFAQKPAEPLTAADYLKKIPAVPGNTCLCDPSAQRAFLSAVSELRIAIRDDADERERKMNEYMSSGEEDLKANMLRMSGMSEEDVRKLQSGKEMTEAEQMAMADKMMRQQANISMDEAKKLQKMSKAEKEAWAQGYMAEQQAKAKTGNQQKNPMSEMAMKMSASLAEQSAITTKVQSMEADLQQKFDTLIAEARTDKVLLEKELQPFKKIIGSHDGEGATQKDIEDGMKASAEVKLRQDKYCQKWTPKMLGFLKECMSTIESSFPDYDHMEELAYQSFENQAGKKIERKITGIKSIRAVGFYLGFVENTFKFRLN